MTGVDRAQIKKDICEVGRRLYQRGYIAAMEGNISVRVSEARSSQHQREFARAT